MSASARVSTGVCKGLNRKYQLMQGKSKLNTDVSKLRGKEKVRYQLVQDIAKLFIHPSVKDWDSYLDILRQHGITVKEKTGKSGRTNLYYCVGKDEFWYKKLDPYLSRENLEKAFKARSEKQKVTSQTVQQPVSQKDTMSKISVSSKSKSQSKSFVIPGCTGALPPNLKVRQPPIPEHYHPEWKMSFPAGAAACCSGASPPKNVSADTGNQCFPEHDHPKSLKKPRQ